MKLPSGELNLALCPSHLTSTYICGVTIVPKVYNIHACQQINKEYKKNKKPIIALN